MVELNTAPVALSDATLEKIRGDVSTPDYNRAALTPGIVHIGLGNFHRGHQAWYLHRLMQKGLAKDWAIIGAGVRAYDEAQRKKLVAQDFLSTLILLDPEQTAAEITGSMIGYAPIQEGNGPLIAQMSDPAIRIVAMTVTEGGYFVDPATNGFDVDHPDIQHDLAHPETPRTAFGAIVAALRARRAAGTGPFTLLSCDNLQGNGRILRQAVVTLARLGDAELGDWIDQNCSFPNSMVDCIVPATGPKELTLVQEVFGILDQVPVTHEAFRQWVIEDDFCAGRPDWDVVGATFSDDVHAFEAMKLRLLNGGHQILANAGELLGVSTISECMSHPLIGPFFRKVAGGEIVPLVADVPGMTPEDYLTLITRRFANPRIVDTTRRVAFDGSARHAGFLLPTVRDALAAGRSIDGLALVEALWARMCAGTREDGSVIQPNDPIWDALGQAASAARENPAAWLELDLYGELAGEGVFVERFAAWLERIWAIGVEDALIRYIES